MYPTYALNGDQWSTPASTLEGFWSALGAGAQGLSLKVLLTKDNVLVCAPSDSLMQYTGEQAFVSKLTLEELQQLDAGACWRSIVLDENGQPTGARGEDTPWLAPNNWQRLSYPELSVVLQTFSRRTLLQLILPPETKIVEPILEMLTAFGLNDKTLLTVNTAQFEKISQSTYSAKCLLNLAGEKELSIIKPDTLIGLSGVYLTFEQVINANNVQLEMLRELSSSVEFGLYVTSKEMPFSFTDKAIDKLKSLALNIHAIVSKGTLPSVDRMAKSGIIFQDSFKGDEINSSQWAIGYSHYNDDTKIVIDNSLIIDIKQGGHYSGGAAVMKIPTHGDFDAQVGFHVTHPHQGTTFELAAISIDPSYKSTNLTYDVHGAPPYASSERDENDGFRCGWNNSFTVTDFISTSNDIQKAADSATDYPLYGEPYSSNIYNCYGRDVGYGEANSPSGQLRLVRRGQVFNSYYRDKFNKSWVCSGTMLVQNMPQDIFIRLAAKHWKKKNPEPPHNQVTFSDFILRQY